MRCLKQPVLAAVVILAIAGCAASETDTTQISVIRAECDQRTNCFNQYDVRDFRVLDNTSMVVFVGSANCPYRVNVDGFFCNLRSLGFLSFRDFDGRICSLDRSYLVANPFAREDEYCEIRSVEPLNDDELVETFAAYGILEPLPAVGSGELEVIETTEDEEAAPAAQDASPGVTGPVPADVAAETG